MALGEDAAHRHFSFLAEFLSFCFFSGDAIFYAANGLQRTSMNRTVVVGSG